MLGKLSEKKPAPLPAKPNRPAQGRWYPISVDPPRGTKYPCDLTALPNDLPGIPRADVPWFDHTFTLILEAVHAKLILLEAYRVNEMGVTLPGKRVDALHATYRKKIVRILEGLAAETPPNKTLSAFRQQVTQALQLQLTYFKAMSKRMRSLPHPEGYNGAFTSIPAGRTASGLLIRSWSTIQVGYPVIAKDKAFKNSVYHHLCALDLF